MCVVMPVLWCAVCGVHSKKSGPDSKVATRRNEKRAVRAAWHRTKALTGVGGSLREELCMKARENVARFMLAQNDAHFGENPNMQAVSLFLTQILFVDYTMYQGRGATPLPSTLPIHTLVTRTFHGLAQKHTASAGGSSALDADRRQKTSRHRYHLSSYSPCIRRESHQTTLLSKPTYATNPNLRDLCVCKCKVGGHRRHSCCNKWDQMYTYRALTHCFCFLVRFSKAKN